MRITLALLIMSLGVAVCRGQAPPEKPSTRRYQREVDLENYPQATPKQTLDSVVKALGRNRVDYLLAQLADPAWVDKKVKDAGGQFDALVEETTTKLAEDPATARELQRFLEKGEWDEGDAETSVHLADVNHRVFFRKVAGRWFLENRMK